MKKGYFAVWYDSQNSEFESTGMYSTSTALMRDVNFFEDPRATGHVVIFYSDGKVFFPVQETWMPEATPKLNWRVYQPPE